LPVVLVVGKFTQPSVGGDFQRKFPRLTRLCWKNSS